ncbi:flagellar basal body rod protein FlgC [Dasania marina]|uniref:flagellar basal body rod protein FlgC n=1 Tax=Dasania marina TaxID=471499 RepID=UPI0030DC8721|tara:strand:- start:61712 stop:62152 length:441 start_codon:yes stop_codon:yes gene_type:complete
MSISSIFDIAGSGMAAQSLRLNTTASNLANAQAASSSIGEVYRARHPVFSAVHQSAMQGDGFMSSIQDEASVGVKVDGIVESDAPLQKRYEPQHPKADKEGYVYYPNVNVVEEMADMISSSRSFQMNVEMMNSAKTMMRGLLSLGQ